MKFQKGDRVEIICELHRGEKGIIIGFHSHSERHYYNIEGYPGIGWYEPNLRLLTDCLN